YNDDSPPSAIAQATTPLDTVPAEIVAIASVDPTTIILALSEPVDPIDAENPSRFSVASGSGPLPVLAASYDLETAVTLTVAPLSFGTIYDVSMDGVADLAATPNLSASTFELLFDPRLVARWTFDEGRGFDAADSGPHGHDATTYASGWIHDTPDGSSHSLRFNGTSDWVDAGTIDVDGNALTLSAWFRAEDLVDGARILSKATGVGNEEHFFMLAIGRVSGGAYRLAFRVRTGTATTNFVATSGDLSANEWHHAVAVYNGTQMRLSLDGVLVASRSKTGLLAVDPTVPVAIGNQPALAGGRPFSGLLDDVRIYRGALTDAEIAALYCGTESDPHPAARPTIVAQPIGGEFCEGEAVVLSVDAGASNAFTYVWRRDGLEVPGADGPTLVIETANPDDSGSYAVEISSFCGSVESVPVEVHVAAAATIETPPQGGEVCAGDEIVLSVSATGAEPLAIQWRKDGVDLPGANGPTLAIADFGSGDAGSYDVVVSNGCGMATSAAAVLGLGSAPSMITEPGSASICEGEALVLSVEANGAGPLAYQWTKEGVEIAGATSATYSVPAATSTHAGTYRARVTNACGETSSAPAVITVSEAPAITSGPETQDTITGGTVVLEVEATGSTPIAYTWRHNGVAIPGASGSTLVLSSVAVEDAGVYRVEVANVCGETSAEAVVSVIAPPAIVAAPQAVSVCAGDAFELSVTISGTEPFEYRWRKDGVAVPGATSRTMSVPSATEAHDGSWTVAISNAAGSVTSDPVAVEVRKGTTVSGHPESATACEGETIVLSVEAEGSDLAYQWRKDTTPIAGATSASLVLEDIGSSDTGSYDVVVSGSCGEATSAAAGVTVRARPRIIASPTGATVCALTTVRLEVSASGSEPLSYTWRKNGQPIAGANGPVLDLLSTTPADSGTYDVVVSNDCDSVPSSAAAVTIHAPPAIEVSPIPTGACEGESVVLSVVASGTGPFTYEWRKNGSPIPGANGSELQLASASPADEGSYDVIVSNACGAVSSAAAFVDVGSGPIVSSAPSSIVACAGGVATFAVVAGGINLRYQWRKGGMPIAGATGPSLSIGSVQPSDAGAYDVVVTSDCGEVITAAATLSVETPVAILTQPISQSLCANGVAVLSVEASGPVVGYEWRKDGFALSGASTAELRIEDVTSDDAGAYSVVVRGECNDVQSAEAILTVTEAPRIVLEPESAELCEGGAVALRVEAEGANLSYQWRRNGAAIESATGPEHLIEGADLSAAGAWDVVVTNGCGEVISSPVEITVLAAPRISGLPSEIVRCEGESVTIAPAISGAGPLTYRWRKDGVELPGANGPTLDLSDLLSDDEGLYALEVEGACGTTVGSPIALRITETCGTRFLRSDANTDLSVDISDAITTLNYLFRGGVDPTCVNAFDSNDDESVDIADAIYLLGWLFRGGEPPPPPNVQTGCGTDPTGGALTCESYPCS
ncbi:MAG TPA: immunoglobulin domain-containing protein, partial [Planctomycetota bacterium]|nr:immunoglobulin domain-containing protein [Planctomycetota bacterium]